MMLKPLIALTAAIALAGCAATSPAGQAATKTVAFTSADLTNAMAISQAAGDVDHGVECFHWMNTELPTIQAELAPATPATVTGAFSALETATVAVGAVQTGITPALRSAAENACGPYVMYLQGGLVFLIQKAAAVAPGVSTLLPVPLP